MGLYEVEDLIVTGHPEQTEKKMVGFLDPGQWTSVAPGPAQVFWTAWVLSRW